MTKGRLWDRQRTTVLLALADGLSRAAAASRAGDHRSPLRRWVADEVEFAMGAGRAMYEESLRAAGDKDWRAALAVYEVVYLGGVRAGKAQANATVVVQSTQQQVVIEGPREAEAQTKEVLAILREAYGGDMERVAHVAGDE